MRMRSIYSRHTTLTPLTRLCLKPNIFYNCNLSRNLSKIVKSMRLPDIFCLHTDQKYHNRPQDLKGFSHFLPTLDILRGRRTEAETEKHFTIFTEAINSFPLSGLRVCGPGTKVTRICTKFGQFLLPLATHTHESEWASDYWGMFLSVAVKLPECDAKKCCLLSLICACHTFGMRQLENRQPTRH